MLNFVKAYTTSVGDGSLNGISYQGVFAIQVPDMSARREAYKVLRDCTHFIDYNMSLLTTTINEYIEATNPRSDIYCIGNILDAYRKYPDSIQGQTATRTLNQLFAYDKSKHYPYGIILVDTPPLIQLIYKQHEHIPGYWFPMNTAFNY